MAQLTAEASSCKCSNEAESRPCTCKVEPLEPSPNTSPLNPHLPFKELIFVRYLDHVLYNRTSATAMKPQTREAVGWLVYNCERYITIVWDRDADPPTLHGGDPKASGLVLLKTDLVELISLEIHAEPSKKNSEWHINSPHPTITSEYALQTKKRKTQDPKRSTNGDKN